MIKVLIVDDSDLLREELKDSLEEAGFCVYAGNSGVEGLKIAETHTDIDLIVCDLNMPLMNGIEMARRIRELSEHKKTPMIMLTTESSSELKKKAAQVGISGWMVKPHNVESLIANIKDIVSNHE